MDLYRSDLEPGVNVGYAELLADTKHIRHMVRPIAS